VLGVWLALCGCFTMSALVHVVEAARMESAAKS
jgi:hypothetical protein